MLADVSVPHTFMSGQVLSSQQMNANFQALRDGINSAVPAGTIVAYGGTAAPDGWLMCNGAIRNQGSYPKLFAAIGTAFGNGDGTGGSFNVPDFRGRFLRGVDGGTGRDPDRGARTAMNPGGKPGDEVGSLQSHSVQSHVHPLTDPGHSHSISQGMHRSVAGQPPGGNMGSTSAAPGTDSSYTGITMASFGGSETRPINAYVNYIIKY